MSFKSQEEYDQYARAHGKPASPFRAILVDPDGKGTSEVPADGLQRYLDKGFTWPEVPALEPAPVPEPPRGITKRRK